MIRRVEIRRGQAHEVPADLHDRYGPIDILANNGGPIARPPALDFPLAEWDRVLEVNLTTAFFASATSRNLQQARVRGGGVTAVSYLSPASIKLPASSSGRGAKN